MLEPRDLWQEGTFPQWEPGHKTCFQGAKAFKYQQATRSNPRDM